MKKLYSLFILSLIYFSAESQNVGIGTSSPGKKLDVNGSVRIQGDTIFGSTSTATQFNIVSNGGIRINLDFNNDGSETFGIKNGVGTIVFDITEAGAFTANGNGTISGDLTLSGSSRTFSSGDALDISGTSGIDIIIDSDNGGTGSEFVVKKDGITTELFKVAESGVVTVTGLAGGGDRNLTVNNTGQLVAGSADIGDVTGVTAGNGLTGGGTTGSITLNAVGDNGLTTNSDDIDLGGTLNQATTITQGAYNMIFDLTSTGNFEVRDNGATHLYVSNDKRIGMNTSSLAAGYTLTVQEDNEPADLVRIGGDSYGIEASNDAAAEAVILGTHSSTSTASSYYSIGGTLSDAGNSNAFGYLGYHRATGDQAYSLYGTGGDYGAYIEKNVGIGEFGPSERLVVGAAASSVNEAIKVQSYKDASVQIIADNNDSGEDDNPYLLLSQDGAQVKSLIGFSGGANLDPQNTAYTDVISNALLIGTTTVHEVQIGTNAAVRMTVLTNGNVGIGTTAPAYNLETVSGGTVSVNDGYVRNVKGFYLKDWDDDTGGSDSKYRLLGRDGAFQFYNGGVVVGNYDDGTWSDLGDGDLIVEGDVGIGTTSPDDDLDVVGIAQISNYLKVGNPTAPVGVGATNTAFYHIDFDDQSYWNFVQNYCTGNWTVGLSGGYQPYSAVGSQGLHLLHSPYIWVPNGYNANTMTATLDHESNLEAGFDGVYLEYKNGASWTKVTSWSSNGYNDATVNGSGTGCTNANSAAWTCTFTRKTSVSNTQTLAANSWTQLRLAAMEDVNGLGSCGGDYRVYELWLKATMDFYSPGFMPGGIYAEGHIYAQSAAQIGDVAEYFPVKGETTPGDLISMDPEGSMLCYVSTEKMNPYVIGVHSAAPSVLVNSPSQGVPVGLTGRVAVKVADENGAIKPGDFLTASSKQGYAMKATEPCFTIGRALETLNGGDGQVLCIINPGWYNPNKASDPLSSGNYFIMPGQKSIKVFDAKVSQYSRVFASMRNNPGSPFWISSVDDGAFEIEFGTAVTEKVYFDYFAASPNSIGDESNKSLAATKDELNTEKPDGNPDGVWTMLGNSGEFDPSRFAQSFNPPSPPPDPSKCWTWDPVKGFVELHYQQ